MDFWFEQSSLKFKVYGSGCSLAAAHPGGIPLGFGGYVGSSLIETTVSAEREVSQVLVEISCYSVLFAVLGRFIYNGSFFLGFQFHAVLGSTVWFEKTYGVF